MSTPERKSDPGATISVLALVVAGLWVVGAGVAAFALLGPARIQSLTVIEIAAIVAAMFFPALMAMFSGVAARDSARARAEAARLADAADRLLNPERSAEAAARQLAMSVRGEISTLDQALEKPCRASKTSKAKSRAKRKPSTTWPTKRAPAPAK
ncbi:MAG: hypothetical protein M0D54_06860 [Hyphomonadaceae bacterium JAD_PAG50586_4]|nr:MAG: hypothetical protein M0D54_06860 [Hyphomonadaceae bacterium JAD_PAG50586_4]